MKKPLPDLVATLRFEAERVNMAELARTTGLSRAGLYKALREDGNPGIVTVTRIAEALGLKLDWKRTNEVIEQAAHR